MISLSNAEPWVSPSPERRNQATWTEKVLIVSKVMVKVSKMIWNPSTVGCSHLWQAKQWRETKDSQVFIEMIDKQGLMHQLQVIFSVRKVDLPRLVESVRLQKHTRSTQIVSLINLVIRSRRNKTRNLFRKTLWPKLLLAKESKNQKRKTKSWLKCKKWCRNRLILRWLIFRKSKRKVL